MTNFLIFYNIISIGDEKLKKKFANFMKDRYGIDNLYIFLFTLYFILIIINMFINSFILTILELIIVIIMFYRMFSKNRYKRSREEEAYLKIRDNIKSFFKKNKYKDKDHVYKKCSKCKTTIRLPLPSSIGFKYVTCPKCKNKFKTLVLRKQKVELIRKKS